jgi:hypothetical protein
MVGDVVVDTTFDVRSDAGGRDPDSHSATLRRYHRLLWGKPLPGGAAFDLDAKLHHKSDLGEFWLSSDAITHTYSAWTRPAHLVTAIRHVPSGEMGAFYDLGCTIGAYLVFPSQVRVDGKWRRSINQARGMHPRIRDRFDLTLECIRLHYDGQDSPLAGTFAWYSDFFNLFEDFRGYVDHFLLNDLVDETHSSVRFFVPFDGFSRSPLPATSVDEYREYMRRSMEFITARNERIRHYTHGRAQRPDLSTKLS